MRVLLVDNMQLRRYGNVRMLPDGMLAAGAVRNGWRAMEFSDRDIGRYLSVCGLRPVGERRVNRKLVETALAFRPDVLLIGHCDFIRNRALAEIRSALPSCRSAHFNYDAIWQEWTCAQIRERMESTDGIFTATAGPGLRKFLTGRNFAAFMPTPCDDAFETEDNSRKTAFRFDLLFCGRDAPGSFRDQLIREVSDAVRGKLRFGLFGMFGNPPVFSAAYEDALAASKMSLNLSREDGWPLYSSDRIGHLMANGILTFQSSGGGFQRFFSEREMVFFDGARDLIDKILYYHAHDDERRAVAAAGRAAYRRLFNSARVLKFMVETLAGVPYSEPYEWADEVYR